MEERVAEGRERKCFEVHGLKARNLTRGILSRFEAIARL